VNHIVVATLQGEPTEGVLEECQNKILYLISGSGIRAVLYDFRQLTLAPSANVLLHQEALDQETHGLKLRRAVVVSNASIGYLARLAFSAGDCLVFLNDYAAAVRFLSRGHPFWPAWSLAVDDERRVRERRCQVDRSGKEIAKPRTHPKVFTSD
jgi:hypothetical protein